MTSALSDYLQQDWPGVAQVAQLTRTVTTKKTGKTTIEVVYIITTLSREQASPQRLLELFGDIGALKTDLITSVTSPFWKIALAFAPECSTDPGCFAQSGHYPYSSARLFSDCFDQTLLVISS